MSTGSPDPVAEPSPALVVSLALHRAHGGGVTKLGNQYFDQGFLTAGYLGGAFDVLIEAGLLTLGHLDPHGLRRITLTDTGHTCYTHLHDTRHQADPPTPDPEFPTTASPTGTGGRSGTPSPGRHGQPGPLRGRGPVMHWARCPTDGRLHAITPPDTEQPPAHDHAETRCGRHLPAEELSVQDMPTGAWCLPCVIADLPDPGRRDTTP